MYTQVRILAAHLILSGGAGHSKNTHPHLSHPLSTHFLSWQSLASRWEGKRQEKWRYQHGKEAKKERESLSSAAQLPHVSSSGLGSISIWKAREAVQKVKERGSCPMRDNKNRPHRPLWRSCSPLPTPHAPPSTLDHFHTPDATAMMTVDHKLLTKSSQVMWKSRWQF